LAAAAAVAWSAFAAPAVVGDAVAPAVAQEPATTPFATWPLDDLGAGVARDAVGHRDGRVVGTVVSGQVGQGPGVASSRFDGAGEVVARTDALTPTTVAASAWVETTYGGAAGTLVDTGGLALQLISGHPVATTCASGPVCTRAVAPASVDDGAWHLVTASVDAGTTSLFVDGTPAARVSGAEPTLRPADGQIVIGRGLRADLGAVSVYGGPLAPTEVDHAFRAGACPQLTTSQPVAAVSRRLPSLPLHTRGRYVVDAHGHRVKLAGVNWYGAEELDRVPAGLQCQSIDAVAAQIVAGGFNVVRLPWATDTWLGAAPPVAPIAVAANPLLRGRDARAVFDAVVDGLARHGLMVILDNHVTRPDWCCSGRDGNALWWQGYDPARPPAWHHMSARARLAYFRAGNARWLRAWRTVVRRYRTQRVVVGADLRNEPREDTLLGLSDRWSARRVAVWADWPRAATRAGNAVLRIDRHLLVVVEGTGYATQLRGVATRPVRLSAPHRLVYSAHDYAWSDRAATTPATLRRSLNHAWGWLLAPHRPHTTPVWVGEFGTYHPEAWWCSEHGWFSAFTRFLRSSDVDWAYWAVNGTGARGAAAPGTCDTTPRFPGCGEGYGLSDATWSHEASPTLSATLRSVAAPARRS
jgi:endoglucanase